MSDDSNDDCVVRVRGLPWSCTEQQLRDFFRQEGAMDKIVTVHFTYNREGRPSGEAYIKFMDMPAYEAALVKDKQYLNKRYVEVFPSKQTEMDYILKHSGKGGGLGGAENDDAVVRMRGLPYGCTKEEIASFFLGLEISPNGIVILSDPYTGRSTGEAFVQFNGKETAEKALQKHLQKIGHRYIEVFRSSLEEMRRFMRRVGGMGAGSAIPTTADLNMSANSGYAGWSTGAPAQTMYAGGYSPEMTAAAGMFDPAYAGEFMYLSRNVRPTPYDRPGAFAATPPRARTTAPLSPSSSVGYSYRGYNGGGRMVGTSSMVGGAYKGYVEGGYPGGLTAGGRAGRTGSGYFVHMRGLPFSAGQKDVVEFFSPLRIANVDILYDSSGRPSGEARVEFYTQADAQDAMKRDRDKIGHRYVELFMSSATAATYGMYSGYQDFATDRF